MNTSLAISGVSIKQDSQGRFCLNDLHKAAGGEKKHQPTNWLRLEQTTDLIMFLESEELNFPPIETVKGKGKQQGTYVVKELVYAYAMWISAKFHITVIRAYDALVNNKAIQQNPEPPTKKALPNGLTLEQQDTIKALIKSRAESLPKEQQTKAIITCWSSLKSKFGLDKKESYKNIKPENFNAAISLLARLPLDGELLENQQDKITIELKPLANGEIRRVLITQLANGHTTVWDLPKDIKMHTLDEFVSIVQKHYVMINRERIDDITIKQLSELLGYGLIA